MFRVSDIDTAHTKFRDRSQPEVVHIGKYGNGGLRRPYGCTELGGTMRHKNILQLLEDGVLWGYVRPGKRIMIS